MPPISGALAWCRNLLDRVQEPIERLRQLVVGLDREDAKEIEKMYSSITQQLSAYEQQKIEEWKVEINETSTEKLKLNLLARNVESK